jgi:hypothetical protein
MEELREIEGEELGLKTKARITGQSCQIQPGNSKK